MCCLIGIVPAVPLPALPLSLGSAVSGGLSLGSAVCGGLSLGSGGLVPLACLHDRMSRTGSPWVYSTVLSDVRVHRA